MRNQQMFVPSTYEQRKARVLEVLAKHSAGLMFAEIMYEARVDHNSLMSMIRTGVIACECTISNCRKHQINASALQTVN